LRIDAPLKDGGGFEHHDPARGSVLRCRLAAARKLQDEPAQIGVLGEVADVLVHVIGVDLTIKVWHSMQVE
jgi:hypothetical protein